MYKVVTLCGSSKFKEDFERVAKELTLKGYIILTLNIYGHSGDTEVFDNPENKKMLDDMHRQRIDISDEIYIINKDGYIGESTLSEIKYAFDKGKEINYLEPKGLRKVLLYKGDWGAEYDEVRMKDLKPGDKFTIIGDGKTLGNYIAKSEPYTIINTEGYLTYTIESDTVPVIVQEVIN